MPRALAVVVAVTSLTVFALAATPGEAQTCNLGTQLWFDHSAECPLNGREQCSTGRIYLFNDWSYGGTKFLLVSTYTSVNFYDVTNPVAPTSALIPGPGQPCSLAVPSMDTDELQWDISLLDDDAVGFAVYNRVGWVTFRVNTPNSPSGFTVLDRYNPGTVLPYFHNARLFRDASGARYVVGPKLSKSESAGMQIGTLPDSGMIQVVGTLSGVGLLDPIETLRVGSTWYLFARTSGSVKVFDLSNPAAPTVVGQASGYAADIYLDKQGKRLYTLSDKVASPQYLRVFDVANPTAPTLLATIVLAGGNGSGFATVAGAGDLVVASRSNTTLTPYTQAFSLSDINNPQEVAAGELGPTGLANEATFDLELFQVAGGDYAIYRAAKSIGTMTRFSGGCVSTAPHAAMTITNLNAANAQAATCGGANPDGFPGDTFRIEDRSSGIINVRTFEVRRASDNVQVFTSTWNGTAWNPPLDLVSSTAEQPGEYRATLMVSDGLIQDTAQQSLFLCANPKTALTTSVGGVACPPTGCAGLVNDTVAMDAAATSGTPTGYHFVRSYAAAPQTFPSATPTYSFPLDADVQLGVVAHYAFAATDDAACADAIFTSLGLAANGTYDSCVKGPFVDASTITGGIEVKQGTTVIPDGGSVQRSVLTSLRWTGRAAPNVTPTFQWAIAPAATITDATLANASIAGGTLALGSYTLTLTVTDPALPNQPVTTTTHFTAVDSSFTYSVSANPVVGGDTVIALTSLVGSFDNISIVLPAGLATCDGLQGPVTLCGSGFFDPAPCNVGVSRTFKFANQGSFTLTSTGTSGTSTLPGPTYPILIGAGTCVTCPSVAVSSVAPTSATVNQARTYTAVASGGTITQYTFSWGDGTSPTVTSSASAVHTYTTSGNKTLTVTAANDCGNSGQRAVTVAVGTGGGGTLTISASPNPAPQGSQVVFTFSPKVSQVSDVVTFQFGDGQSGTVRYDSLCQIFGGCDTITHTYQQGGTFTVTGSGVAGGAGVSGSTSVTISSNCQVPSAPIANASFTPSPARVNVPVQFTDLSTNDPTAWSWDFGDGLPPLIPGGKSYDQNPVYTFTQEGTFTVTLTASNCRGSSQKQLQVTVTGACTATEPPVADFDWSPKGPLASYPDQNQPFEGQQVTLLDASTNDPYQWHWYDFQQTPGANYYVESPKHTWDTAGDKNVRLVATNCKGPSPEKLKIVTVYPDIRPVTADFTWTPSSPQVGEAITFTAAQGFDIGNPKTFTWRFPDDPNSPVTGAVVTRVFTCGGPLPVTLTAARGSFQGQTTKSVTIEGDACGPQALVSTGAAKAQGLNGTFWRTDMRIFNASTLAVSTFLGALPIGQDNANPFELPPVTIPANGTLVINDVVDEFAKAGQSFQTAAIRVRVGTGEPTPMVAARTYTDVTGGGTYGQSVRGVEVYPNSTPSTLWITGVSNTGTTEGFRTNFGINNLRGDAGVPPIDVSLYGVEGTMRKRISGGLAPYGYIQDSIKNLFGAEFENIGTFALRIDVPPGFDVEPYASLVDNHTGDPVMISGQAVTQEPLLIPGVAHLPGENSTLWRTSIQLTNPDDIPRTWEVEFLPKQNLPAVRRDLTLAPAQSQAIEDLVAWVYDPLEVSEASGVVRITPADGRLDSPIAVARTFNLTPGGTFGQEVPALHASLGAWAAGGRTRLLLTHMSSQDVARSNLGFVNLSSTATVNFEIFFYDESGNLLNPEGRAYTFALGPLGWDQDKLENRFAAAFGTQLPAGLRAISAIVRVTDGGPGFVYASVIDPLTGDPVFIRGQQAP